MKGDGREVAQTAPAERQRAAIDALLVTLRPAELDTPERLAPLLSAGQSGERDRQHYIEVFDSMGRSVFDPLTAADVAAGLTLDLLFDAERLTRLVDQHRRDPGQPGVSEVVDKVLAAAFAPAAGREAAIARRVQWRAALDLAAVARKRSLSPQAAAEVEQKLAELAVRLKGSPGSEPAERAHRLRLAALLLDKEDLGRVLAEPKLRPDTPPGMPIGDSGYGPLD